MKKYIQAIGYVTFLLVSIGALITAVMSYKNPFSLYENPLVWILIVMLFLVVIVKEYFSFTIQKMQESLQMEKDGVVPEEIDIWEPVKKFFKGWTKTSSLEEEGEIILDHNYDGIKELDNVLPPWWVYLFYGTIVFAVIYLVRFEIMDGDTQQMEYTKEVALAKKELAKYKQNSPNTFDISQASLQTNASSLKGGKSIFNLNCASCHAVDGGGGIGPNLTDENWILGGGFKNVFNTIYNGGRDGKGMIAWNKTLKPKHIQNVASYIVSLQGTTPAKPKKAQGEVWVEEPIAVKEASLEGKEKQEEKEQNKE